MPKAITGCNGSGVSVVKEAKAYLMLLALFFGLIIWQWLVNRKESATWEEGKE